MRRRPRDPVGELLEASNVASAARDLRHKLTKLACDINGVRRGSPNEAIRCDLTNAMWLVMRALDRVEGDEPFASVLEAVDAMGELDDDYPW